MQFIAIATLLVGAYAGGHLELETASCAAKDLANMALVQEKAMGADCEGMCKKLGAYPNCQCPGFNGQPASSDDTRGCYTSHCQDPSSPCPNDAFTMCVGETTKTSALLEWKSVMHKVDARLDMLKQAVHKSKAQTSTSTSCAKSEHGALALLAMKATNMGIECEDMCKRLGAYPKCECPGFGGQAASEGDTRSCYTLNCQDPSKPCPNAAFNTCVDETSAVSALQWKAVMSHASMRLDALMTNVRARKAAPKVPSLPEQGYEGKGVKHENMKTITKDWGSEYGPTTQKPWHSSAQSATAAATLAVLVMTMF